MQFNLPSAVSTSSVVTGANASAGVAANGDSDTAPGDFSALLAGASLAPDSSRPGIAPQAPGLSGTPSGSFDQPGGAAIAGTVNALPSDAVSSGAGVELPSDAMRLAAGGFRGMPGLPATVNAAGGKGALRCVAKQPIGTAVVAGPLNDGETDTTDTPLSDNGSEGRKHVTALADDATLAAGVVGASIPVPQPPTNPVGPDDAGGLNDVGKAGGKDVIGDARIRAAAVRCVTTAGQPVAPGISTALLASAPRFASNARATETPGSVSSAPLALGDSGPAGDGQLPANRAPAAPPGAPALLANVAPNPAVSSSLGANASAADTGPEVAAINRAVAPSGALDTAGTPRSGNQVVNPLVGGPSVAATTTTHFNSAVSPAPADANRSSSQSGIAPAPLPATSDPATGDSASAPTNGLAPVAIGVAMVPAARAESGALAFQRFNVQSAAASGAENIAVAPIALGIPAGIRKAAALKYQLQPSSKELTSQGPRIGIGVATLTATMPAGSTLDRSTDRIAPVATVADVRSEPALPSAIVLPSTAHRAVEAVLAATDRFAARDQHSVNLQFSVGGNDLSVRVELRGNEVHTTFRTDSADLRAALANEWQAVTQSSNEDRSTRLATPLFTANTNAGSGSAGDESRRQPTAQPEQPPAWSALGRSGNDGTTTQGSEQPITLTRTAALNSRHLQTLA